MVLCSHEKQDKRKSAVEKIVQKVVMWFETHRLTINAEKTKLINFSRPSKNESVEHLKKQVKDKIIETSSTVKCSGVCSDQNITIGKEIKKFLRKFATGTKVFNNLQNIFSQRMLHLNALVISPLQNSAKLLSGFR